MSWSYSGRPEGSERDSVRFMIGDICKKDPLVQDEEIAWAISSQPGSLKLAAAVILRALAARFSRRASMSVGGVSKSCSDVAKAYADRAKELDPTGQTAGVALALPRFGGLTHSEKETLARDTDAVQPDFVKGQDDIPGGPDWQQQFYPYDYYPW